MAPVRFLVYTDLSHNSLLCRLPAVAAPYLMGPVNAGIRPVRPGKTDPGTAPAIANSGTAASKYLQVFVIY